MLRTKIRNTLIRTVIASICTMLAGFGWSGHTGRFLRLFVRCIQKQEKGSESECIRALILPKAGFTEDAMACFGGKKEYIIYTLDRPLLKGVYKGFLPEEIDDFNYISTDPEIEKRKSDLRAFWVDTLKVMFRNLKIDVVLSGNYSYAAEQEFTGALCELGVPFVAIHKECLKTPLLEEFFEDIYRNRKNKFQGTRICVYNAIEDRVQIKAEVTASENIVVTGMPRLDVSHSLRKLNDIPQKPTVLFFSFNTRSGLPLIGRKLPQRYEKLEDRLQKLNFEKLARSCHLSMVKLAQDNPGIRVVIKTKGNYLSNLQLNEFLGKDFKCPENLEIISGGNAIPLLEKSSVVCGFNSTALLEAIAMNKPVIIPKFYESLEPESSLYIVDLEDAVECADSPETLIRMLKEAAEAGSGINQVSELEDSKQRILEKWLGNPDGEAGLRVRNVVTSVINENRKTVS